MGDKENAATGTSGGDVSDWAAVIYAASRPPSPGALQPVQAAPPEQQGGASGRQSQCSYSSVAPGTGWEADCPAAAASVPVDAQRLEAAILAWRGQCLGGGEAASPAGAVAGPPAGGWAGGSGSPAEGSPPSAMLRVELPPPLAPAAAPPGPPPLAGSSGAPAAGPDGASYKQQQQQASAPRTCPPQPHPQPQQPEPAPAAAFTPRKLCFSQFGTQPLLAKYPPVLHSSLPTGYDSKYPPILHSPPVGFDTIWTAPPGSVISPAASPQILPPASTAPTWADTPAGSFGGLLSAGAAAWAIGGGAASRVQAAFELPCGLPASQAGSMLPLGLPLSCSSPQPQPAVAPAAAQEGSLGSPSVESSAAEERLERAGAFAQRRLLGRRFRQWRQRRHGRAARLLGLAVASTSKYAWAKWRAAVQQAAELDSRAANHHSCHIRAAVTQASGCNDQSNLGHVLQ